MVSKVLLLVVYFFFFSVQVFFRYTPGSMDTDAFQCAFVTAKTNPAYNVSPILHQGDKKGSDSILNKRFEPVTYCVPCQEFRLMPAYSLAFRTYYLRNEVGSGRSPVTVSLRGPPAMG
jgi:hypothetical protein